MKLSSAFSMFVFLLLFMNCSNNQEKIWGNVKRINSIKSYSFYIENCSKSKYKEIAISERNKLIQRIMNGDNSKLIKIRIIDRDSSENLYYEIGVLKDVTSYIFHNYGGFEIVNDLSPNYDFLITIDFYTKEFRALYSDGVNYLYGMTLNGQITLSSKEDTLKHINFCGNESKIYLPQKFKIANDKGNIHCVFGEAVQNDYLYPINEVVNSLTNQYILFEMLKDVYNFDELSLKPPAYVNWSNSNYSFLEDHGIGGINERVIQNKILEITYPKFITERSTLNEPLLDLMNSSEKLIAIRAAYALILLNDKNGYQYIKSKIQVYSNELNDLLQTVNDTTVLRLISEIYSENDISNSNKILDLYQPTFSYYIHDVPTHNDFLKHWWRYLHK